MAGLWMREDGEQAALAFDNMAGRPVKGTTEWTEYSIQLPIHADARRVFFGVLLVGSGTAWADDLQLLVDGKPVTTAPKIDRPKTVFELDSEFNAGSRIQIEKLTPVQIENLATLGRVWGFLKYHHPKVRSGALHWDYRTLSHPSNGIAGSRSRNSKCCHAQVDGRAGDCTALPAMRGGKAKQCCYAPGRGVAGRYSTVRSRAKPCPA